MSRPWLIVAGDFSPSGGMDKANYELARCLALRHGRDVAVVTHRADATLANLANVSVTLVPRPGGRHFLGARRLARAGRSAADRLSAKRPVVVVNGGNCSLPGVNWVHMVHRTCPLSDSGAPVVRRIKNRIVRVLHRRQEATALRAANLVIANSFRTRRDLIEGVGIPADRIRVVYLAADAEAFAMPSAGERASVRSSLGLTESTLAILFVGALGYDLRKGFDTLLAATAELRPDLRERVVVLAVGSGALEFWRGRVSAAGLADRVRILGPRDDVPSLMGGSDLLVSPTRFEPYGLAVHEAWCRGLPAITSRIAGVSERYPAELTDLVLPDAEDAADLARRIANWWDRREALAPAAMAFGDMLRKRTWDDMTDEFVALAEAGV